ncbi:MAG: hypothetical protein K6F57_00725 [Candidatus Saccharibacteria bacterium]|nr:hypothetical protein [Candidatus Saccharibacteria bacterium]
MSKRVGDSQSRQIKFVCSTTTRTQNWPNPDMITKMYIPILEGAAFIECIQIKKEKGGDGRQKYIIPQVFFGDELEKTGKK